MKEADRRLQWCPHRRTTVSYDPPGPPGMVVTTGGNNSYALTNNTPLIEIGTCIGSGCSQWRWDDDAIERIARIPNGTQLTWTRGPDGMLHRPEPAVRPPGVDISFVWNGVEDQWQRQWSAGERPGHCGLSGPVGFD